MSRHIDDRPHPLRHEATLKAMIIGGGAIGAVVGVEVVPMLTDSATQVIQLLTVSGAVVAAPQAAARAGEKHVTPVNSPRDNDGNILVPAAKADPIV